MEDTNGTLHIKLSQLESHLSSLRFNCDVFLGGTVN